jgi:hypothetical protein
MTSKMGAIELSEVVIELRAGILWTKESFAKQGEYWTVGYVCRHSYRQLDSLSDGGLQHAGFAAARAKAR